MNSFTDAAPVFPYKSSTARSQLGVPDSPEIHLAITTVAELLLPVASASNRDEPLQRNVALRVASGAVLFGWPLSAAEQEVRDRLDLPLADGVDLPEPRIRNEKDWLAEAAEQLRRQGVHVDPKFQHQRTEYGWRKLDAPAT